MDRRTHRQTPHDGIGRAYASHRAEKTELNSTERSSSVQFGFPLCIGLKVQNIVRQLDVVFEKLAKFLWGTFWYALYIKTSTEKRKDYNYSSN